MARRDKINYYLDIAQTVLERSTCIRRHYGSIIVNNDQIISTGYGGAPRGRQNCVDIGTCVRESNQIPRGERYEVCRSVHAEANSIIHASRSDMSGATLYLVGKEMNGEYVENATSCSMCKRLIINSGIAKVIIRDTLEDFRVINVYDQWVITDESLAGTLGY